MSAQRGVGVGIATVEVELEPRYAVRIGPGALEIASESLRTERGAAILSDRRVAPLYAERLRRDASVPLLAIEPGEAAKDFAHLAEVLEFLASAGLDRGSTLYTLGGGVIGDLGGLAAALYMRGIAVVHCPTTLLAQVDASVGGKTAVNLVAGKNLAGVFHQPRAVYADTSVLATLDDGEFASGLGEVVKSAVIAGEDLLALLERSVAKLRARDPAVLADIVERCVRTKAGIVAQDPLETGRRKALNLGHTFAHAIEHAAGYGTLAHGVAVGVGVVLATDCSAELGILRDGGLAPRLRALLAGLGLPTSLAELRMRTRCPLAAGELLAAMALDKKGRSGEVRLVLPRAAGDLELTATPGAALLGRFLAGR